LPHQQDTGGFFVAVIEKLRPLPWEAAAKALPVESEEGGGDDNEKDASDSINEDKLPWGLQRKRRRIHGYREDPFVFFTEDEPLWPSIRYQ
jgi:tRNA (cytosine34-C5)-methyltransferase